MTVTALPTPKCTMGDARDKLGYAGDHLDSGRFALAHLMDELHADHGSTRVIECVILTLAQAAAELKVGLDAVTFEHEAFKAWEAKNANPAGKAGS